MGSLLEDLVRLPRYSKQEAAWARLTDGRTLFDALRQAVADASSGDAGAEWTHLDCEAGRWKTESQEVADDALKSRKVEIMRRLIRCAGRAAEKSASAGGDIDRALASVFDGGRPVERPAEWGWMRTYLDVPTRGRAVEVPAAWVDKAVIDKTEEKGFLVTLHLEVVQGSGEVYLHPGDALATQPDEPFEESLKDAWNAACQRAGEAGVDVFGLAGRYRVLGSGGRVPAPEASGRSASGAGALGWYLALRDMFPDEGVIVMLNVKRAEDSSRYKPVEVRGITQKVEAVIEQGRFDTIVVGSDADRADAEAALSSTSGAKDRIRVLVASEL